MPHQRGQPRSLLARFPLPTPDGLRRLAAAPFLRLMTPKPVALAQLVALPEGVHPQLLDGLGAAVPRQP